MIQEFSITNYRSYKDKQTFSFEATEDTLDLEGQTVLVGKQIKDGKEEDVRLLKFAVVYGANASGKTNLLEVFEGLRLFWSGESVKKSGLYQPFLLDNDSKNNLPSEYELLFWTKGVNDKIQWKYNLSVIDNHIVSEKLSVENVSCISEETKNCIEFLKVGEFCNENNDNTMSKVFTQYVGPGFNKGAFFSQKRIARPIFSLKKSDTEQSATNQEDDDKKINVINDFMIFWSNSIIGYEYLPKLMLDKKQRKALQINIVNNKEKILHFLKKYDFNITDIVDNSLSKRKKNPDLYTLHTYRDLESKEEKSDWLPLMKSDSQGTYSVMILLLLLSIRRGSGFSFKCFDELESSLHPEIVEHLIDEYMHNPIYANSQLLITTHDTSLLRTTGDLLRPDEIWFTDKGEDGATSLYSLADFNDLEEVRDFQGAYLHGVFGAVPKI